MTADPFGGRPPPPGYGAQISKQGDVETWRNLICHKCGGLLPDDSWAVKVHDEHHRLLDRMADAVIELKKQFVIEEE